MSIGKAGKNLSLNINIEKSKRHKIGQTKANMLVAILYQIFSAACGLILPRYILRYFGSDVNGMLQTIGQFLTYTVLMESGVGGLVMASFYKPLAEKDEKAVSDIFLNTKKFFARISYVYFGLVLLLCLCVKFIIRTDFDFPYVAGMVLILSCNYYFNYYFAMAHRILLRADQKIRVIQSVQIVTMLVNLAASIIAIKLSCGIHAVKLISTLIYLSNPLIFRLYVRKHYAIGKAVYDENRTIPRKSSAMIHHIAFFVHANTDIVLLSLFNGTKEVSVYSVYNSVVYTLENFFVAISDALSGSIGQLLATNQKDKLRYTFETYRLANTVAATFICVAEALLIVPFVSVYTKDVTDINYLRPLFAGILVTAQWFYCVRIPYNCVIYAAGHYEQTKFGAYLEVILNLGISLALIKPLGMVGVALGTAIAMAARSVYMAWYLSKQILHRPLHLFFKEILLYGIAAAGILFGLHRFIPSTVQDLTSWVIIACISSVGALIPIAICVILFDRKHLFSILARKRNSKGERA